MEQSFTEHHRAPFTKKPLSRLSAHQSTSSSVMGTPPFGLRPDSSAAEETDGVARPAGDDAHANLVAQVFEWLQQERTRRRARKFTTQIVSATTDGGADENDVAYDENGMNVRLERTTSQTSESGLALEKLEKILVQYAGPGYLSSSRRPPRRRQRGLRSGSTSESDFPDFEGAVPSVDACLDNSKTLAYVGGAVEDDNGVGCAEEKVAKDTAYWLSFKTEIVRILHTLRLKGWRNVPMELASDVDVTRLSGALTNAVYLVSPPKSLSFPCFKVEHGPERLVPKKPPS